MSKEVELFEGLLEMWGDIRRLNTKLEKRMDILEKSFTEEDRKEHEENTFRKAKEKMK